MYQNNTGRRSKVDYIKPLQECCHPDPGRVEGRFDSPVHWAMTPDWYTLYRESRSKYREGDPGGPSLATVIVRSSTNLRRTLSFLMTTGLLGKVDLEYLDSIEREEQQHPTY